MSAALAAACGPDDPVTPQHHSFELLKSGAVVFATDPQPGRNYVWTSAENPNVSGDFVTARYRADVASTEVDFYDRNTHDVFAVLGAAGQRNFLGNPFADAQSALLSVEEPAYPYPHTRAPADVGSTENMFPDFRPDGELHEIRLMDHGQCSASLSIHDDVLVPIQQELWGTLVSEANAKGADVNNNGYYSIAYLDHATNQPNDARGGFFVDFAFTVVPPWPIANRYVEGRYSYEFGLDGDGTLVLGWHRYYWKTSCSGVGCGKTDDAGASFASGMENDLPGKFHDTVLARQHVPFQIGTAYTACSTVQKDCVGAPAVLLGMAIESHASAAGLSGPEVSTLKETVKQAGNWACEPSDDPSASGNVCKMKLAATRLNVYPDTVELVWFDAKRLDSMAYAMHVATFGTDKHAELCNGVPPTPPTSPTGTPGLAVSRHFAADNF